MMVLSADEPRHETIDGEVYLCAADLAMRLELDAYQAASPEVAAALRLEAAKLFSAGRSLGQGR